MTLGTSFGSMGILFPLVIPIICELTEDEDLRTQTSAAILGGCVFGNVVSPIADNTVLTSIATSCDLDAHIKTETLYVSLVGAVSVLFCTLPVGMGAYSIYVGLPISAIFLLAFMMIFASTDIEADSVFERYICSRSKRKHRGLSILSTSAEQSASSRLTKWFRNLFRRKVRNNYESIN